jgi:hypothetical protein
VTIMWANLTDEDAASTFLHAALAIDVPAVFSPETRYWSSTAQGQLVFVSAVHALRSLKALQPRYPVSPHALHLQTIELVSCLAKVLRNEVMTCHSTNYTSAWLCCVLLKTLPWHSALESFIEYVPVEMGALLRFVTNVHQEKEFTSLHEGGLHERVLSSMNALLDMIPRNEEADRQLQSELASIDAWPETLVVSNIEPQGSHGKTSPALSHHDDREAHGSTLAGDPRASGADGPHCPHVVIDVDSQLELPHGASTIATPALTQVSTMHASDQKGTDSEPDASLEASAGDKEPAPNPNPLTGAATVQAVPHRVLPEHT